MSANYDMDDFTEVIVSAEQIAAGLDRIAGEIKADYADKQVLLIGVLKGAVMVMADLSRRLPFDYDMDWMAVSSYGNGTRSSGVVRILKDLDADLTNRHVLIVEDVVDTGMTLNWLVGNLKSRGAASVEVATLLRKPEAMTVELDVKYIGFDIPKDFVVGYGLDYAEKYRTLPFVAVLDPKVYSD